jgi:RNA polymerase sigma-70 factor (ECF subfamily)
MHASSNLEGRYIEFISERRKTGMSGQILRREKYYEPVCEDRYAQLSELISLCGRDVINLAYAYVKDRMQAEDIAQEAFLKAFTHIDQFQHLSSLKTWVYSITINTAKDHLRSNFFRRWLPCADPLMTQQSNKSSSAEEEVLDMIEKREIWNAVFDLPVKYREVVILYYREGFSISDIAEMVGTLEGTIRTRLRRARIMLEQKMAKGEGNHGSV